MIYLPYKGDKMKQTRKVVIMQGWLLGQLLALTIIGLYLTF